MMRNNKKAKTERGIERVEKEESTETEEKNAFFYSTCLQISSPFTSGFAFLSS